jgi:cysteine-S-conjugate beta-lyase
MKYDFDRLIDRRNGDSIKWNYFDKEVLPLWVADMDFVSPEPVIQALIQRAHQGVFGYPRESEELKGMIRGRQLDRYGWQVQPEAVVLLPGVMAGVHVACHMLTPGQDGVMVQTPVYPPILKAWSTNDLLNHSMQLTQLPDGSYAIDWDAFEAAISPQTRLFILCNPHNPLGRVFHRDELERMADICLRHDILICSDEIHEDLLFPGSKHIPIASLDTEVASHTITLTAPSKTFNIAGLHCSAAIIPDAGLRERFLNARKGLVGWIDIMSMTAALAAYREGQEWLDQVLGYLKANRDFLHATVSKEMAGISMAMPEGTYLAWLDCRAAGIPGNPYQFFLERAHVGFNDGVDFGPGGEGFVRMNFGCPRAILEEALERMKEALTGLKN